MATRVPSGGRGEVQEGGRDPGARAPRPVWRMPLTAAKGRGDREGGAGLESPWGHVATREGTLTRAMGPGVGAGDAGCSGGAASRRPIASTCPPPRAGRGARPLLCGRETPGGWGPQRPPWRPGIGRERRGTAEGRLRTPLDRSGVSRTLGWKKRARDAAGLPAFPPRAAASAPRERGATPPARPFPLSHPEEAEGPVIVHSFCFI